MNKERDYGGAPAKRRIRGRPWLTQSAESLRLEGKPQLSKIISLGFCLLVVTCPIVIGYLPANDYAIKASEKVYP